MSDISWADLGDALGWSVTAGALGRPHGDLVILEHPAEPGVRIEILDGIATRYEQGGWARKPTFYAKDPRELVTWIVAGWYLQMAQTMQEKLRDAALVAAREVLANAE